MSHSPPPVRTTARELPHGFRATLDAGGFTEVHTTKLVESATESGAIGL